MTSNSSPPSTKGKYKLKLDNVVHSFNDKTLSGRQILEVGQKLPPSDFSLIWLKNPGSTSVGTDEDVTFVKGSTPEFLSFLGDRIYRFSIDEIAYEWGAPNITGQVLANISDIDIEYKVFLLQRQNNEPQIITENDTLNLDISGTEHLVSVIRKIEILYRDEVFHVNIGNYTGAQLSAIFGVPSGYVLDLFRDGNMDEIGTEEVITICNGMQFVSHPPSGQSS